MKRKKKSFVCKWPQFPWCRVKARKTVQRIPGMLLVMRRPRRQTEQRCHCQSKVKKGRHGRGDRHMTKKKKRIKKRSVCCKRETKTLEGGRCPEAVLETEGCGGGETGRKMKEPPAVSPSPTLRSAPLSTDWG